MNCKEARHIVLNIHPRDIDVAMRSAVSKHFTACAACAFFMEVETDGRDEPVDADVPSLVDEVLQWEREHGVDG